MASRPDLKLIGATLHARLVAGSSLTVTSEIAEVFTPILCKSLYREFFNIGDLNMIDTAVTDALVGYFAHPERYEPTRSSLFTYLRLRAGSNLLNLLSSEQRHHAPKDSVEVEAPDTVYEEGADNLEEALIKRELNERVMGQLRTILPNELDQELASLMIDGVRETQYYAEKLGILNLPEEEKAQIVKRNKDRIKRALQRKYKREDRGHVV